MDPILIKTIQFFLSLSLLIVLHELGHFIPAKIFKTRVEKFYLFFDVKFSLFKKKIGETEYGIGWLPLGGYVKIAGMIDESMDTEAMKEEPKPWEFRSKPAWQRLIIMLGGVTVNFVLAVIIYIGLAYSLGDQYIPNDSLKDGLWVTEKSIGDKLGIQTGDKIVAIDGNKVEKFSRLPIEIINGNTMTIERNGQILEEEIPVDFIATLMEDEDKMQFLGIRRPFVIGKVLEDSPNQTTGFLPKDVVVSIAGQKISYFDEAQSILQAHKGEVVSVEVKRGNDIENLEAQVTAEGMLGIETTSLSQEESEKLGLYKLETKKYTFAESIPAGIEKGVTTLTTYAKNLKKVFNPETGAYKGVGGFASIGGIFPDTWDWIAFWNVTALLSIMLAFMNILPIPALDGGHVMFLLYEIITGRKPSDKFLEYAQMVGFLILIALLLFANGNDFYKWISK